MRAGDVTTTDVITVAPETSVQDLAALLANHGISGAPVVDEANNPILSSNRHQPFDSARENKAMRIQDHLKRAATANLLISQRYYDIWWRLPHNTATTW